MIEDVTFDPDEEERLHDEATGARPVDGAGLLQELHDTLVGFVVMPSQEAADALVLWVAATHAQPAWEHATRFVLKSPIKRCGKTRAQEIARELAHAPLSSINISVAALVRSIDEENPPTLVIDEADTIFGRKADRAEGAEDLRGILNSGHSRGWPYIRWDPSSRRRDECPTFAMALIGGIGDLPDTIEDRAVVVSMRRRAPGEPVRPFRRRRVVPVLHQFRDRLHAWMCDHLDQLEGLEPDLPVEDRAADVWEPLVAVADLAGGEWPQRARWACEVLSGEATVDEATAGERLLADLADVWGEDDHNFTTTILDRLHALEEAPWDDWYGKPLTDRGLAKLLRPYGIRSRTVRTGEATAKGYARADLADSWCRYVTGVTTSHEGETGGLTSDHDCDGRVTEARSRTVTGADQGEPAHCDAVTDVTGARSDGATEPAPPPPGDEDAPGDQEAEGLTDAVGWLTEVMGAEVVEEVQT